MIFVDTVYLIAMLDPRDALHPRALAWAKVLRGDLVVTQYVLWELLNYFSASPARPRVHPMVDAVHTDESYTIEPASEELWARALALHRRVDDKEWSLTDCASFVTMKRLGIRQALTHDIHFEQAGFEPLLRQEPTQQGNI